MTKTTFIIVVSAFFFAGLLSAQTKMTDPYQETVMHFRVLESDYEPGKFLFPGDTAAAFVTYAGDTLPMHRDPKNRMITLVSGFVISAKLSGQTLALFLPPFEYAANIYLNGSLIGKQGDDRIGYTNRTHYSKALLLSSCILRKSEEVNYLTVQLYPHYGETNKPFGQIYLSGYDYAARNEFLRNLLGPGFSFALIIFSALTFFHFLSLHLSVRETDNNYYLYFSMLSLAAAFSQVNNAFSSDFSNVLLLEKFSKTGYNMTILMNALFVFEYTNAFKRKITAYGTLAFLFAICAFLVIIQDTYLDLLHVYQIQVMYLHIPVLISIVYYLIRYASLKTDTFALYFLIVIMIYFAAMAYDSLYYFVYQVKPYANITPYGQFLLTLFLITIISAAQRKLKDTSVNSERALKVLYGNMENLVEERTAELHTTVKRLNQEISVRTATQQKLNRVNKTKDKILSIVAHDLKNIFNSMISYAEFIANDVKAQHYEHAEDDIRKLQQSSKRAYNFLENILDWSVYEMEVITYVPEKVNVLALAMECLDLFKSALSDKGLTGETAIPADLFVAADTRMVKTILRNLISNAIKYSFKKGSIIVSAEALGDHVEIAVIDFGKGVGNPDEILVQEVQPSERGTASERGSGLGLYIVKDFLERHGSSLKVKSNIGLGSIFSFTLHNA